MARPRAVCTPWLHGLRIDGADLAGAELVEVRPVMRIEPDAVRAELGPIFQRRILPSATVSLPTTPDCCAVNRRRPSVEVIVCGSFTATGSGIKKVVSLPVAGSSRTMRLLLFPVNHTIPVHNQIVRLVPGSMVYCLNSPVSGCR